MNIFKGFDKIKQELNEKLKNEMNNGVLIFEDVEITESHIDIETLSEVAMKRVVRGGRIVRKVKVKKKGFKVQRIGNQVKYVRMTQKEKRLRRKSARMAWRTGKASRKNKAKRTMIRSRVRMRQLYGK